MEDVTELCLLVAHMRFIVKVYDWFFVLSDSNRTKTKTFEVLRSTFVLANKFGLRMLTKVPMSRMVYSKTLH